MARPKKEKEVVEAQESEPSMPSRLNSDLQEIQDEIAKGKE
jgi:hypothetical protein